MNFSRSWEVIGLGASVVREEQECGTCVTSVARSPSAAEFSPLALEFSSYAMIVHVTVHVDYSMPTSTVPSKFNSAPSCEAHVLHVILIIIIIITLAQHSIELKMSHLCRLAF